MSAEEQPETTSRREGWWDSVGALWRSLPDKPLFGGLLLALVLLFHFWGNSTFGFIESPSLFGWLYYVSTTNPDDQHCLLVPLVVLGLLYWKREELMAVPKAPWWPALFLIAFALALHVAGFLVQQTRVSIVAFVLALYGLMGLVWGYAFMKATFFPMFLFAFAVPLGTMADTLTFPLRLLVSKIAVLISHVGLGIDVIQDGVQIFDSRRTYTYEVAAACSGIRSLVALLALTTIYGFVTFKSMWRRLFVMALAAPLAVLGNVLRLTLVIIITEVWGPEVGTKWETNLGFLTFALAIGCMILMGQWLQESPGKSESLEPVQEPA